MLFLKYFYDSLFFFIHFPVFLTQVYRFYGNFSVFHFFHLFSAFLFYATAFLLNFIDYFPESVISDFSWIAAYISRVCSHLFLQVWCVIILGIEEVVCFQYICTLFIILHTLFRFLTQVYRYFCYLLVFQFLDICFKHFPLLRHHILAFLILLHKFWSLTWIIRLFPLLNFLHNFSNFFYSFFGIFYLSLENCVCFWNIFTFLYFCSYIFPFFLTQVYRFYRNFLVFHFFHLFSAFLFYATAFLLNFIDYFPESVISDFSWIAAYISGVCSHLFFTSLLRNYFRHWGGCLL